MKVDKTEMNTTNKWRDAYLIVDQLKTGYFMCNLLNSSIRKFSFIKLKRTGEKNMMDKRVCF